MRMRSVLVGLLAVCAVSLAGAASASAALPEFMPKAGGSFPVPFHGLIAGLNVLQTTGGEKIECNNVHVVGQFLNGHLGDIHLLFLECGTTVLGAKASCGNKPGASSKEILLEGLFHLGYITTSPKLVGVLVNTDKTGGELVAFECEAFGIKQAIKVTGEVVGHIPDSDLNNSRTELTVEFKQNGGKQEYQQITLPLVSETELMTGVHLVTHREGKEEESAQESPPGNLLLLPAGETGELLG